MCKLKQDSMTELKYIAFVTKNMENLKPIPKKSHSTTYQQVKKALTVEEGGKLRKINIAGFH